MLLRNSIELFQIEHPCVGGNPNIETIPRLKDTGVYDMPAKFRPDRDGTHRKQFEKNKAWIYATQDVCGICGRPVDKTLKYPHPLSKCIDHIIPVSKGGHPSDKDNLQLAHWTCNRQKSDKLFESKGIVTDESMAISNRLLPQSINWLEYKSE